MQQQTGARGAGGGGGWAVGGSGCSDRRLGGSQTETRRERGRAWGGLQHMDDGAGQTCILASAIPPPGQPYPARRLAHTQAGKSERWMFIEPIRPGPASVPKNRKEPVLSPNAVVTSYTPAAQAFSLISGGSRKTHGDRPLSTNQHTPPSITPSKHQTTAFPTQLQSAPRGICKAPRIDNWGTCILYRLHIETRRTTATH
jgi:hypothetical protein